MRISLRELMIFVAVAAVGLAGLKFASSGMLPIVQALTGLLLAGFLVKAIVDQGSRRAFAIGFMACASAYTLVLSWTLYRTPGSADEAVRVTPVGTFGTTTVLEQMYKVFVTQRWFDAKTGKAIPSSNFALGAPPNATYVTRIEQIPAADDKTGGPAQGTNREPSSIISEQFGTRGSRGSRSSNNNNIDSILIGGGGRGGRGGRGRGRGGGGSIAMDSFGNAFLVPADFAPQQSSEYIAADEGRRAEIDAILQTDEGRQAIVGGAPLRQPA
jgi:hypothetical protein